jgi:hypothetical protein
MQRQKIQNTRNETLEPRPWRRYPLDDEEIAPCGHYVADHRIDGPCTAAGCICEGCGAPDEEPTEPDTTVAVPLLGAAR